MAASRQRHQRARPRLASGQSSKHDLSSVERLRYPLGRVTADTAQPGHREECLVGKPTSSALTGKVSADRFDLPAKLYLGQWYKKSRIAEVAVVFRNFVLEHEVITEGVVGEFGHQSVVLVSVALPMSQDDRRIEIAFDRLEAILDLGSVKREVPVAEIQHLDLLFRNVFEEGGRAAPRLCPAQADTTEDDPSHDELGHLGSEAQNGSTAADFDVVGVGTQAEELQRPSRLRRKNQG